MNSKEDNERVYLLRFLSDKIFGLNFKPIEFLKIEKCQNDPPDFVIETKEEKISIEITSLYEFTGPTQRQATLNGVLSKLIKKVDEKLTNKYYFKICEGLSECKFFINENKVAEQLFQAILDETMSKKLDKKSLIYINGNPIYKYCRHLSITTEFGSNVGLFFTKIKNKENIGVVAMYSLSSLNRHDVVLNSLNKKNLRLLKYKNNFDKNYLLLVADPYNIKGCIFKYDDNFYKNKFEANFDKVFIMEIDLNNRHKVTELKLKKNRN